MQRRTACLTLFAILSSAAHAQTSTTVARWVELAPGSSAHALEAGKWGDAPANMTPTVLVRAIVTDAAKCPAAALDHGATLVLGQRFIASQLTDTPGTPGAANGRAGYKPYFVSPAATSPARFANGTPMATTNWGECEAVVPPGHVIVTIDGVDLKLPVAKPRRILVIADTGCRMNGALSPNGGNQQNCASPAAFPWAYLANYEASFRPDVILHAGDWFYRDTDCNNSFPGCADPASANYEVWGDTFDGWNADVFFPAKTLLAAAPWIMVRGNHESCGRGARGWYALLDPFPIDTVAGYAAGVTCATTKAYPAPGMKSATYSADFEPSYVVPVGGVNFLIHDSSFASDPKVDARMAANEDIDLSNLLRAVSASSANPQILVSHKPAFGLVSSAGPNGCAANATAGIDGDSTEQSVFNGGTGYAGSAFGNGVPARIGLFLSGHIHQFQYVNFGPPDHLNARFAPQLIVGMGGTLLDADCNTGIVPGGRSDPANFAAAGMPLVAQSYAGGTFRTGGVAFSHDEFGFAVLDAIMDADGNTTGYDAGIYKISSARAGVCTIVLKPRSIACKL